MKYILGLDLGISSIGWAVVNKEKNRIEDLGVRLFPAGERPKDGGSLNEMRRTARGQRRRVSRKRVRMRKIKELFVNYDLINEKEIEKLYEIQKDDIDVWQLRCEALERKLTNREWARVLTTIAKRRGYKSNRKDSKSEKDETGKVLKAINKNKQLMLEKNYRTVGELLFKEASSNNSTLRNKADQYDNCVLREMLEDEVKKLFEAQRKFENEYSSVEFENEYLEVFNYQKPFMTKKLMEKMIGKCTFEENEPRASKNSWTFERFMLLQKVNNLTYSTGKEKVGLTEEQRRKIITLAYNQKEIKYEKIRKLFDLPDNTRFTGLDYSNRKNSKEKLSEDTILLKDVENVTFVKLVGYHTLKNEFKSNNQLELWNELEKNKPLLDKIAETLSKNKTEEEIMRELKYLGLGEAEINIVKEINFDKYGHLSYIAMNKILPYLELGYTYDKACSEVGYNFKNDTENPQKKLPVLPREYGINPVMYRTVTQTRKLINAIIDKYGSPFEIHIEVARDLSKNHKERKIIEAKQKENQLNNEETKKYIQETFKISNPKPVDILKVKLWREQDCKSAYSLKPILPEELFEDNYTQIDHVLPFSKSFDDSYNNKVLVITRENQEKRNRIPREFISNEEEWEKFEAFVNCRYKYNPKKRENLLMKNFDDEKAHEWRERNLNDTKFISRYLANYITTNLLFDNFGEKDNRKKVKMIPGAVTASLRHYWGIPNKDREKDLHHAEDAVILACADNKNINKIQEYSKEKELYYRKNSSGEYFDSETGLIVDAKYKDHTMQRPWPEFKEELEARMSNNPRHDLENGNFKNYNDFDFDNLKPIFVSRMPKRKVSGEAHAATIYSKRENGIIVIKKKLSQISKKDIEDILNREEYKNLYLSDKSTYDAIYNRLELFNFKAEKAFGADFVLRKKAKNGLGPVVKSIKIPSKMTAGVDVQNGIASNGDMVRVDIFEKDNKFYAVPIYVADIVAGEIPNKAIKANKPKNEWLEMDEKYTFKFSLYHYDLVKIKRKNEESIIAYYVSTHSGTGAINLKLHDGEKEIEGIGIQNLEIFEKFEVDLLGNYYKVRKEERKGGKNKKK